MPEFQNLKMHFNFLSLIVFVVIANEIFPASGQLDLIDDGGDVHIHCAVTPPTVKFRLTVKITGWIGLGLSRNPNMANSDLFIGGIRDDTTPYFNDYYGVANGRPREDDMNNWEIIESECSENASHTVMSFTRLLKTLDVSGQDIELKDEDIFMIWAYGFGEEDLWFHGGANGVIPLNLYIESLVTDPPVDETSTIEMTTENDGDSTTEGGGDSTTKDDGDSTTTTEGGGDSTTKGSGDSTTENGGDSTTGKIKFTLLVYLIVFLRITA